MIMNYVNPDMEGYIPKTDSRYRGDLRHYEEGRFDEAENEKNLIEEEQRRKRRVYDETKQTWVPKFFREIDHPFIKTPGELIQNVERPFCYELIKG